MSCASDCGICETCGNGRCDDRTETCYTCPEDCGICVGCGDGVCSRDEDCASCARDCGVCSVCGNERCEPPYEDCINCSEDCGECEVLTCDEVLFCVLDGCLSFDSSPPDFSVSCIGVCTALACDDVRYLVDEVVDCAVIGLIMGEIGSIDEVMSVCSEEVAACLGARC